MKGVVCTRYGPPDVLRLAEVERPVPGRNEVRIRILAACVTVSDCVIRGFRVPSRYRLLFRLMIGWNAPRHILGMALAGKVDAVGRNVSSLKEGDEVFGMNRRAMGAYAEEVCWPAGALMARRPANLTFEEAAAIPYGGLLAMHCLRKAKIRSGQRVLVYGASGAIGTAAVQLAKHFGAHVTGVCSTANLELVKSLGAAAVLDYTREDFTDRAERYDVVFDAAGKRKSAAAMRHAARALTPGGVAISIDDDLPKPRLDDLELLKCLAESGALKPVIDRCYRLDEIAAAHAYVEQGHKRGNVIVSA